MRFVIFLFLFLLWQIFVYGI
uniref:Uncharacterized protein n=1 Tax=Rhizophora mucronata TaxID=61149 RepID=A0A2P2P7I0_RHIMU